MRNIRNYNQNHFFAWDSYSLFFIQGVFKSHLKKNHLHVKCQFLPKIPIWLKSLPSLLHKTSEKWLNPPLPSPITQREGGCKLWGHAHFGMNESNTGIRNNLVVLLIAKINIFKQQLTCYQWESLKQLLKLVSAIFINFLFFQQMIALQKLWKMLFISSKKFFLFSRYSNFCISGLPSFLTCRPLL